MAVGEHHDLAAYCLAVAERAQAASIALAGFRGEQKNNYLLAAARQLRACRDAILAANAIDVAAARQLGLTAAEVDRLTLSQPRLEAVSAAVEQVATLADPVGEVIEGSVRPNGLEVSKVRVPLGVVFFIYESRPNVTVDAAALCVKSGNAVILRGGKEAAHSNRALLDALDAAAGEAELPRESVQLVSTTDRAAVGHFLALPQYITVAIPRGGEGLIRRVAAEAQMPVMKHFDGNCHVYVDRAADPDMAEQITVNSKCQRLGVCNAAESLLVHRDVADLLVPRLAQALQSRGIELRGDEGFARRAAGIVPATEADHRTEFLGPIMSCKVVDSLDEAILHINRHGSRHTDAIVTSDLDAARSFVARVDSAAVMVNASTRFNDGGELGLGAEIGISTDKFHARGPCGLRELTTYKWVVYGRGQLRQ